jgi:hypothetical protein
MPPLKALGSAGGGISCVFSAERRLLQIQLIVLRCEDTFVDSPRVPSVCIPTQANSGFSGEETDKQRWYLEVAI